MKLIFILQWKKIIIQDIRIINLAFYLLETLSHFIGGNILKLEVISNSFYFEERKNRKLSLFKKSISSRSGNSNITNNINYNINNNYNIKPIFLQFSDKKEEFFQKIIL